MWIWKHEFYTTKRIVGARALPQLVRKVPRPKAGPVNRSRVYHLFASDHLKTLRGQACGIFAERGQFLVDSNVWWHVPIWIELKKPNKATENGCSVIGLADNNGHAFFDFTCVYATQFETSYVYDQVLSPQVLGHPSQTFHSQNDAIDTLPHRYIHAHDRRGSDDPVDVEALTGLKSFDRFDQHIVVHLRLGCGDLDAGTVSQRKSCPNGGHARVGHARSNRVSQRDRAPTALGGKSPILRKNRAKRSVARTCRLPAIEKTINAICLREALECQQLVDGTIFDEEIGIDFARQETTDLEVRCIFKKCRREI